EDVPISTADTSRPSTAHRQRIATLRRAELFTGVINGLTLISEYWRLGLRAAPERGINRAGGGSEVPQRGDLRKPGRLAAGVADRLRGQACCRHAGDQGIHGHGARR